MGFPFNQRWGLALWNWAFVDQQPFVADPGKSAELNRGFDAFQTYFGANNNIWLFLIFSLGLELNPGSFLYIVGCLMQSGSTIACFGRAVSVGSDCETGDLRNFQDYLIPES